MKKNLLCQLDTPCIVIDMEKTKVNIKNMQKIADETGCALRPHIKTHKMALFAKMQIEAGAKGITCAKISEAKVMADAGIDDIFIAYPIIGEHKITHLIDLNKKVKRLIVAVDSYAGATLLHEAATKHNMTFEVRMEVDTGAKRTGVVQSEFLTLAKQIKSLSCLNLTGIYTFKSLVYQNKPTTNKLLAAKEEGDLMAKIANELRQEKIDIKEISAGSTPTGPDVARTGQVTEIRPGTYIFNDYMLFCEESAQLEDVAVRLYATVVSTPCKEYAVVDGGTKTFPMDILLNKAPYYYDSYAIVQGNDDLKLTRLNEEHGILSSIKGDTGLKVGDIIEFMPVHVCTTINMQNNVWLLDNNELHYEKVDARGALT